MPLRTQQRAWRAVEYQTAAANISITYVSSRTSVSPRGFLGCLPRFDSRVSQMIWPATQLPQGCRSVTSHFTRLALHVTHASFARFRGGSDMLPRVGMTVWGRKRSRLPALDFSGLATTLLETVAEDVELHTTTYCSEVDYLIHSKDLIVAQLLLNLVF
jgi:hypothetical protein